jgi:LCP family protein required for cell wall assembly
MADRRGSARRSPARGRYRLSSRPAVPMAPRGAAGRIGYALSCILMAVVLVASGFSYFVVRDISSIGGSHAIVSGPSIGAQNILLMGLESRRDWNGNVLPRSILAKLHAGSRQGVLNGVGGNDTNTLILIHIFAGGKRAVGFSIPRDDWVNFAGTVGPQQQGKIDQAYGVSMYYEQGLLRQKHANMGQDRLAFLGNEAGRKAAVQTVEKLTGVHIDHFAEVNLDGFYELAKVFGGVEVCLKHAVYDSYSGANFHKGYQHLDASQALAFVRQRHGLPNGDLDRTHRQQAFLDSVLHQLRTEGILNDLSKIRALIAVAKRYVITDSGWNLLDFAAEMRTLTGNHLIFRTLPIQGYAVIDGQDANVVNLKQIRAEVHAAFHPTSGSKHARRRAHGKTVVDVFNGGSTTGLAAQVSAAFVKAGYHAGKVANTSYRTTTAVAYGPGGAAQADKIAALFGTTATADVSVAPHHVEILLGAGATTVPEIRPAAPRSSTSAPSTGPQGGVVKPGKYGIPCVN